VPVTEQEIAFVEEHGAEALFERWEDSEVDSLDVYRASAV
jgi:hypothetical protein